MQVGGDTVEGGIDAHVLRLGVDCLDLTEVLVDSLGEFVDGLVGELLVDNQHALDRDRSDCMTDIVIVARRFKPSVVRILVKQDPHMLIVNGQDVDILVQRELHDVSIGEAGAEKHGVEGAILNSIFRCSLVGEGFVDIVIGHAVGTKDLPCRDLISASDRADTDVLATYVGDTLDAAFLGDDHLDHFGIAGGNRVQVGDRLAVEELDAMQGIAVDVALDHRELVVSAADKAGVLC